MSKKNCSIPDCLREYYSKTYCRRHYDANRRNGGDVTKRTRSFYRTGTKEYILENIESRASPGGPHYKNLIGPCWYWKNDKKISKDGYPLLVVNGRCSTASRISYILFRGELEPGYQVNHHCDVRRCVNPDHLYSGTRRENNMDALNRDRLVILRGEKSPAAKLTEADVRSIRQLFTGGWDRGDLSLRFGVTRHHINEIIAGRSWAHIV